MPTQAIVLFCNSDRSVGFRQVTERSRPTQDDYHGKTDGKSQSEENEVVFSASLLDDDESGYTTNNNEKKCQSIEHCGRHHGLHATLQTHVVNAADAPHRCSKVHSIP